MSILFMRKMSPPNGGETTHCSKTTAPVQLAHRTFYLIASRSRLCAGQRGVKMPRVIFRLLLFFTLVTSTSASAEIRPNDCARAAQYFEKTRGVAMLMMQNGHIVF